MHSRSQDKLDKDDPEKDKKDKKKEKRNSKHQEAFDRELKPADALPQQSEAVILSETVTSREPAPAPWRGWQSEVAESAVKWSRDKLGLPQPCPSVAQCCRASQSFPGGRLAVTVPIPKGLGGPAPSRRLRATSPWKQMGICVVAKNAPRSSLSSLGRGP